MGEMRKQCYILKKRERLKSSKIQTLASAFRYTSLSIIFHTEFETNAKCTENHAQK